MKSLGINVGNINLKGKKTCKLRCGCCIAQNFKDKENCKLSKKEVREEIMEYNKEKE